MRITSCLFCGIDFRSKNISPSIKGQQYCSYDCCHLDSNQSKPVILRVLDKIGKKDKTGCMPWRGTKNSDGYGKAWVNGKAIYAHRAVWILFRGIITSETHICHICDNPICVNINHLFAGTNQDNIRDCISKGRQTRGEKVGVSKLKEFQVREIRKKYKEGGVNYLEMSERYNVKPITIRNVIDKKTWKHVS